MAVFRSFSSALPARPHRHPSGVFSAVFPGVVPANQAEESLIQESVREKGFLFELCLLLKGKQKALENATRPKTQKIGCSKNLRFRVRCVFGCSLFLSKRAPKHIRKRNTPEIADLRTASHLSFWACCVFGCVLVPANFPGKALRIQKSILFSCGPARESAFL